MSGDRHDVDSEIVLPAGMAIVVPPAATEPAAAHPGRGAVESPASEAEQVIFPPFVHRGPPRQAPEL